MARTLSGKVIVITGAARGIGRAIAEEVASRGAQVALCDIDELTLKQTVAELPYDAVQGRVDVTDETSYGDFMDRVERELGPIDVVINNAGIMPVGRIDLEPDAVTRRTLDVNVLGVIVGSKLAVQRFKHRHRGHIVNIASVAGESAVGGLATYHASKWAALGFTESLAEEVREYGIDVTAVLPGFVDTELTAGTGRMRLVPKVSPQLVASSVAAALERPKHRVYVPSPLGVVSVLTRPLPRVVRSLVQRALLPAGSMLTELDRVARTAYDERIGLS